MRGVLHSSRSSACWCACAVLLGLVLLASLGCSKNSESKVDVLVPNNGEVADATPAAQVAAPSASTGDAAIPDEKKLLEALGGFDPDGGLGGLVGSLPTGGGSGAPAAPSPTLVRESSVSVAGALDVSIVRRVVRRSLPRFNFCQKESLHRNPNASGRIEFKVTVTAATGLVNQISVAQKTIDDKATVSCMMSGFKSLRFPEGSSDTVFSYGLHLLPLDGK